MIDFVTQPGDVTLIDRSDERLSVSVGAVPRRIMIPHHIRVVIIYCIFTAFGYSVLFWASNGFQTAPGAAASHATQQHVSSGISGWFSSECTKFKPILNLEGLENKLTGPRQRPLPLHNSYVHYHRYYYE